MSTNYHEIYTDEGCPRIITKFTLMRVVRKWARNLREMILDASRIARISADIKPSVVNCTLLIVNFTLFWAFRRSRRAFYSIFAPCSQFPAQNDGHFDKLSTLLPVPCSPLQKDAAPIPNAWRLP